ncbi:MAG TPA: glycoside hydrolase family 76 protein [Streptosporangiaceae bacterium]|nr:glycoside hydrolase family 76 protein [Streptosporangiaceae bacterium]
MRPTLTARRIHRRLLPLAALFTAASLVCLGLQIPLAPGASADITAQAGLATLMGSYNSSTGLIGTSWWQAAVAQTTLETYEQTTGDKTWEYVIPTAFAANKASRFENDAMDDTGWWAWAWIEAYDITRNHAYLAMAETDANYIHKYWDSTCGGGLWWTTAKTYKNAIPNELFLYVTAALHNRIPGDTKYLSWAEAEWSWFAKSGMINGQDLVNDGLDPSTCQNNGQPTWTYNQGVILAGLTALYYATHNAALLSTAEGIANAAIAHLSAGGILVEPCEPNCDNDGQSFKGIFVRSLRLLAKAAKTSAYNTFFQDQAASIAANDVNAGNHLGLQWTGPLTDLTSWSQASAEDALVAAIGPPH